MDCCSSCWKSIFGSNEEDVHDWTPVPQHEPILSRGSNNEETNVNNYQTILEEANNNFIRSTYKQKSDSATINANDLIEKLQNISVSPKFGTSPLASNVLTQSLMETFGMSRTEKSDSNNNLVGSANNSGAKQYSVYQQLADPVLSSKKTLQTMDHIGEIVMTNCKRSQVDSRMSALVSFNSLGNGSDSKQSK